MIPDAVFPTVINKFEEPDILVTRILTKGLIDAESAVGCSTHAARVFEERSDIYWISILGTASGLTSEARARLKEIPPMRPYVYLGVVESFVTRTWLHLALRGMVLLGRMSGKIVLVNSEEEARAWIANDRARKKLSGAA